MRPVDPYHWNVKSKIGWGGWLGIILFITCALLLGGALNLTVDILRAIIR